MKNKMITGILLVLIALLGFRLYNIYFPQSPPQAEVVEEPVEVIVEEEEEEIFQRPVSDTMLPQFEEHYAKNKDIVGWISVPNTALSYPVMQSDDNDYYLHRDFNQKYLFDGIPFMDFRNVITPEFYDNTLVYGHNMGLKGNMFTELMRYQKIDFYKKSPVIQFDTLYQENQWKVIAVFEANTEAQHGPVFEYYNFLVAEEESEFQEYLDEINKRSYYHTNVDVKYGDKLLSLQTCLNDKYDTKVVVVARMVRANESASVQVENAKINENLLLPRQG